MIGEIEIKKTQKFEYFYVIRVIQDCGNCLKVYNEIECKTMPTDQEIIDAIIDAPSNCFATVVNRYRLLN